MDSEGGLPAGSPSVDAILRDVLAAGEDRARLRRVLEAHAPEEAVLRALLRRAVPVRLLEHLATTGPWNERPLVLGALVLNPRTPRQHALRFVPELYWRDLAEVAASPRLLPAVRNRAEGALLEMRGDLRPGDRITLGRLATRAVGRALLRDEDPRVVAVVLDNPRLTEDDLTMTIRSADASRLLLEQVPASFRWRERYAVRVALVRQARTPLAIALGQLSSLNPGDLRGVAGDDGLPPLVQLAAQRLLDAASGGAD